MNGTALRNARLARGWTQVELAQRLGVSQTYVSLWESGRRQVPGALADALVDQLDLPATALPVSPDGHALEPQAAAAVLGALGYSGFAHMPATREHVVNPAELVLRTLSRPTVEARVVEALPWVLVRYHDLDWTWLVSQAKLHDLQNRLGFVVTLGRELAERQADQQASHVLASLEQQLALSRLEREDALAGDTLTDAERRWLRTHRSPEAARWNLLSNTSVDALTTA